ncbi:MAG: hypothetical protein PHR64_02355 [Candidatus Shapirobacteria bacterium]|nr:hypothetical protein [Candidatus Shapirobacteria bacterium]MDD5074046.1 hypothetical protein [Candidatus Shapirobacteria bacterium]MDD5481765.1 hypothetical protein [Candidatus Shapirobacteria bacterium]
MVRKKKQTVLGLVFVLGAFFLIYRTSFTNFFSQDDFYHLGLSRADSFADWLGFFNPFLQKDVHFRPLGTQVFFFPAHLFSPQTAPVILRVIALSFHLANFYLVFKLLKKFLKKEFLALILAGVYLAAPLHFLSIYYVSAFQQILAAFWQLLGFWFFASQKRNWSYFFFVFALLSKETAIVFPALLLIFSYIIRPEKTMAAYLRRFKKNWSYWWPFVLILIFYALVRLVTFVHYPGDNYQLSLSFRTLTSSWRWYLVWLLGAPETIIRYAGRWFSIDLAGFVKDSGFWGRIFLGTFLAELLTVCLIGSRFLKIKGKTFWFNEKLSLIFLWGLFFVVSLLSVSFFPYHRYAHYLDLALFASLLTGGLLFVKARIPRKLWVLLLGIFLLNSFVSVSVDSRLHWTPARSDIAQKYFYLFEKDDLCQELGLYLVDSPGFSVHEADIALFGSWGPAYFCQYRPISVYYQGINQPSEKDLFKVVNLSK